MRKCDRDDQHPFGVQTTYRAYVQDTVFELVPVDEPDNENSLGFRPSLKEVTDQPGEGEPPINLLKKIPREGIQPQGFAHGSSEAFQKTFREVLSLFSAKPRVINEWQIWKDTKQPASDNCYEYLDNPQRNLASSDAFRALYAEVDGFPDDELQAFLGEPTKLHIPLSSLLFGLYFVFSLSPTTQLE